MFWSLIPSQWCYMLPKPRSTDPQNILNWKRLIRIESNSSLCTGHPNSPIALLRNTWPLLDVFYFFHE